MQARRPDRRAAARINRREQILLPPTKRSQGVSALLLLAATLSLALALGASAAPIPRTGSCGGERATIVSDQALIVGGRGHDVILAGPGDNEIHGGGGNDTICAGAGEDEVLGERGNDTLFGGAGDDTLDGERGSDRLLGGPGSDRLIGDTGNDSLLGGGGGWDRLEGGPGDDSLDGGAGESDVMTGGPGIDSVSGGVGAHDIASYEGTGGPVTIDLAAGSVGGAEEESLNGIEDAIGGYGNDTIIGSSGAVNRLDGGPGDDRLLARGGADEAFGGPGSDSCEGLSPGAARSCGPETEGDGLMVERYRSIDRVAGLIITGTARDDLAAVDYAAGSFTVHGLADGTPVILGDPTSEDCRRRANAVTCADVSSISASLRGGDDRLTVDSSVPATVGATIDGGAGADAIGGGPGDDTLYGGDDTDPDALEGGAGDDVIFGIDVFHPRRSSGGATMRGGPGDDLLIGGQPCDGDLFDGGGGENDSASFARVHNEGTFVRAQIDGPVLDPDLADCTPGRIEAGVEKIEGSPGPDVLIGDGAATVLLGRGGDDQIDGRGGPDTCIQGDGAGTLRNCEASAWGASPRRRGG